MVIAMYLPIFKMGQAVWGLCVESQGRACRPPARTQHGRRVGNI